MLTVLYAADHISMFHSLYPLLKSVHRRDMHFVTSVAAAERARRGRTLVVVRYFKNRASGAPAVDVIERLRQSFDRIVLFDDSDGADSLHADLLQHVDLYFKKALLRDRGEYCRPMYGRQLFTDYYHRSHAVKDDTDSIRAPVERESDLVKLRLAWNLGVGSYPQSRRRTVAGVFLARMGVDPRPLRRLLRSPPHFRGLQEKQCMVHARFRIPERATIAYQRKLFLTRFSGDPLFLTGQVPRRDYARELGLAMAVVSPFGWGEICYRDFEAIINGAALIKPSVTHLETWPDVFRPGETYVEVSWDADDAVARTRAILADSDARRRMVTCAWDSYRDAWAGLDGRVEEFLGAVTTGIGPVRQPSDPR
jgi:hypothetical protein